MSDFAMSSISILIWELRDVFQCELLAFYLAEMFKDTLCRQITFYLINNFILIERFQYEEKWSPQQSLHDGGDFFKIVQTL